MDRAAELLLACARTSADAAVTGRIQTLAGPDLDWPWLLQTACRHGVAALAYRQLHACPVAVPPAILEALREELQRNTQRSLYLTGELFRVLEKLAAAHIRAIPFKGPTLAALAYGNLGLRPFGDLDLLLPARDIQRARDLLVADGYRPVFALSPDREAAYLRSIGQLPLERDGGLLVELHATVMPAAFAFPLEATLRARLMPVAVAGRMLHTFASEELLLLLCAHGAKHQWERLSWICDVAELIRASPGMDWERVMQLARKVHGQRLLRLGLLLAQHHLEALVPGEIVRQCQLDTVAGDLSAWVTRRLFDAAERRPGVLASTRFYLRARERWRDGARYCLNLALAPTVADWTAFPLPSSLHFLYFLFRPLRLAWKHLRPPFRFFPRNR